MAWVLEQLFGPSVPENPYYEILQDITGLVPWWYPHFIAGCTLLFVILLWAGYRRHAGGTILTSSGAARPNFANGHRKGRHRFEEKRHAKGEQIRHSSAEPQDMEDLDVGFTCWFTDPSRRNPNVNTSLH